MLSEIIQSLANESSTNAKIATLKSHVDDESLKVYFNATLNPMINFYIRLKDSDIHHSIGNSKLTADTIESIVHHLNERIVTGNAARNWISAILMMHTREDQILIKNMINRDANCKVAAGLVNKCWKNLIPEFPVMLADKLNDKTLKTITEGKDRLIVQKKEDGGRVAIVVDGSGAVTVYSRNGNVLETHDVFQSTFEQFKGKVFDGELLCIDQASGKIANRQTGNGIFNKCVRGTVSLGEAITLHAVLWDVISLDKWKTGYDATPYKTRLEDLNTYLNSVPSHKASLCEGRVVSTMRECEKFYDMQISLKNEGAMIKSVDMPWEAKRSTHVLKMKEENDATLVCIGVEPHSKNPNLIGALNCETACGKLKVSIGSGLGDKEREATPETFIGAMIDLQYNTLIKSKTSDTYSMFLPRFRSIRTDVTVADTLEKLL